MNIAALETKADEARDLIKTSAESVKQQFGEASSKFFEFVTITLIRCHALGTGIHGFGVELIDKSDNPISMLTATLRVSELLSVVKDICSQANEQAQLANGLTDEQGKELFDMAAELVDKIICMGEQVINNTEKSDES